MSHGTWGQGPLGWFSLSGGWHAGANAHSGAGKAPSQVKTSRRGCGHGGHRTHVDIGPLRRPGGCSCTCAGPGTVLRERRERASGFLSEGGVSGWSMWPGASCGFSDCRPGAGYRWAWVVWPRWARPGDAGSGGVGDVARWPGLGGLA